MHLPTLKKLNYFMNKIQGKKPSHTIILAYHRVANLRNDPQLLSVTPRHFEEHLNILQQYYEPLSLAKLGQDIISGSISQHSVAITFDDGYVDNLWNAKPLLEKYCIRATVFVTTGYVGSNREFWWDELERILLLQENLPKDLNLVIDGKSYHWKLNDGNRHLESKTDLSDGYKIQDFRPSWNVTMHSKPNLRQKTYLDLHHLLLPLMEEQQQEVIETLIEWSGASRYGRKDYRALANEEIKKLNSSGLIEIGSHSVTHPMLLKMPKEAQRKEIFESKKYLEKLIGNKVKSFSYPYGIESDARGNIVQLIMDAGYSRGCANFAAPVTQQSDLYYLPRFLVRDWNGDEFAHRLRYWFYG